MKMTVWAVLTTDDLTEGRSGNYIKHLCEHEATARRLAKGGYVQGTDCPIERVELRYLDGLAVIPVRRLRVISQSREDIVAQKHLDAIRAAQAKARAAGLTDEDLITLRGAP